ncbi:MFS transporter [Streptomyces sp. RB6PN25]|uniref:MFS transporter n=1 Tax=Streptomyces humicola TaxID=2953240 RepID=A0ABT1Q0G7_9ACTN|nr:MFS transporter [Streptomyces humicola]MCQ4083418.1 MFS transporter [Streptomyces humicola]
MSARATTPGAPPDAAPDARDHAGGGAAPAGFRAIFRLAGTGLPLAAFLARLPAALCPTGTLLMVTAASGIGRAGIVAGALWMGQAVGGPLIGRLADRRGHRPVLLVTSLLNAVAIAAMVAAVLGHGPLTLQTGLSAVGGLTIPQIGPLARTRWSALAMRHPRGRELIGPALSLDATTDELSFVAGPAVVGILAAAIDPTAGLVCAAVLIAVFGVVFAVHPTAPAGVRARSARRSVPLMSPALIVLFAMATCQGLVFGAANAGINAMAKGDLGLAGLVWAATGATSVVAGLLTTAHPGPWDLTVRLRLAVLAQSLVVPLLLLTGSVVGAAAVFAALGLTVAPHLIANFTLVERIAPAERMGEAMTLVGTGLIIGQAIAAPVGGQLAAAHGFKGSFALGVAAAVASALVAVTLVRERRYRCRTVPVPS